MVSNENFAHGDLTRRTIEGFLETYHELGSGYLERVCVTALSMVLVQNGLKIAVNVPIGVSFRGQVIGQFYADMVVNDAVLIEVKAAQSLEPYAQAQLLNYLKGAGGGVGLLLNFGRHPEYKRLGMGNAADSLPLLNLPIRSQS